MGTIDGQAITSTLPTINITAAPTNHFQVTAPAQATLGTSITFTVTALDQNKNPTGSGYTGTVHFTSADGSATLPSDITLTNGKGNFSAKFNTPGAQTISGWVKASE